MSAEDREKFDYDLSLPLREGKKSPEKVSADVVASETDGLLAVAGLAALHGGF